MNIDQARRFVAKFNSLVDATEEQEFYFIRTNLKAIQDILQERLHREGFSTKSVYKDLHIEIN